MSHLRKQQGPTRGLVSPPARAMVRTAGRRRPGPSDRCQAAEGIGSRFVADLGSRDRPPRAVARISGQIQEAVPTSLADPDLGGDRVIRFPREWRGIRVDPGRNVDLGGRRLGDFGTDRGPAGFAPRRATEARNGGGRDPAALPASAREAAPALACPSHVAVPGAEPVGIL